MVSNSDHGSIQDNVAVNEAPHGDGVCILHIRPPRVLRAPVPHALSFGGVPRRLRPHRLFYLRCVLVRDWILLIRVLEPLEVTPTCSAKKTVAFQLHFRTDRVLHAGILC